MAKAIRYNNNEGYPFGMLMPGRVGYKSSTGWSAQPGEPAPDHGLEADIAIDARANNEPPEYTATHSVELTPGFESGTGDAFIAYISPAEEGGGGDDGSGGASNGYYRYGFNGKRMIMMSPAWEISMTMDLEFMTHD